jgi:integrase
LRARTAAKTKIKVQLVILTSISPHTLMRFFEERYRPLRLADAVDSSAKAHHSSIRKLNEFAGHEVTLHELSDDLLQAFMAARIGAGTAARTVNGDRAKLLALWRFARRKKLVTTEPLDVDKIRPPKRIPRAWSVEELGRILDAAAATPGQICGIPKRTFFPALVLTLYEAGLRLSAALSLLVEHLDPRGFLFVPAELQKQGADQVFQLHPETLAAIRATEPADRKMLFPSSTDRKTLWKALRDILKRAGLPHGSRDMFHRFRRTSASHVAAALGTDAAVRHLGHSGVGVTRVYLDPTQIPSVAASAVLPRPAWRRPPQGSSS